MPFSPYIPYYIRIYQFFMGFYAYGTAVLQWIFIHFIRNIILICEICNEICENTKRYMANPVGKCKQKMCKMYLISTWKRERSHLSINSTTVMIPTEHFRRTISVHRFQYYGFHIKKHTTTTPQYKTFSGNKLKPFSASFR